MREPAAPLPNEWWEGALCCPQYCLGMARRDLDRDERDAAPLVLSQLWDCTKCYATQDVFFTAPDGVFEAEDMLEPPTTTVTCPKCGFTEDAEYTGWSVNDES